MAYKKTNRILAIILVVALCIHVCIVPTKAVEPRASYYLDSYQAYVYPAGNGEVQVWFSVTGVTYMDDIGALTIGIYKETATGGWEHMISFNEIYNPDMLAHNDIKHVSHVSYQGVVGETYRAYVCIWAGKDGGGDTRYFWTSAKVAT